MVGAGEQWVFYEIDPDMARVARDTNYFTYLRDTPASVELVFGDGRLSLAEAPPHRYDLLVIDAFNSDAIPIHLLTLEALSMYRSKLSEGGVLLFHLSNRYLDLEPVLGRLARAANLSGLIREDTRPRPNLVQIRGGAIHMGGCERQPCFARAASADPWLAATPRSQGCSTLDR